MAQQQCCGPLQLPVADVAVTAQSHFGLTGAATSIGERPLMGLIDPAAMARMALGESLTNLMWAAGTKLEHIKASVNWDCKHPPPHPSPCLPQVLCPHPLTSWLMRLLSRPHSEAHLELYKPLMTAVTGPPWPETELSAAGQCGQQRNPQARCCLVATCV